MAHPLPFLLLLSSLVAFGCRSEKANTKSPSLNTESTKSVKATVTDGNQLTLPIQALQPLPATAPASTVQVTLRDLTAPNGFGVAVYVHQRGQPLPADPRLRALHRATRISFFDAPAPGSYAIDIASALRRLQVARQIEPSAPLALTLETVLDTPDATHPTTLQRLAPPQASGATLLIPPPGK